MPTMDEAVDALRERGGTPAEVRMLFWPRSEYDAAMARWPDLIQDVADSAVRREYVDIRHREVHFVSWPPHRNQPCWCG
jgi:hypothetical protein